MDTDEADKLLTRSDPTSDLTVRERQLVADMIDQSTPARKRRRYARPIAAGAIAAVLLGGGGMAAAAAAATGLWDPWAEDDAVAVLRYELPSGRSCEMRIGNVWQEAPDEVEAVIREALTDVDFDDADVAAGAAAGDEVGDPSTDDDLYQNGFNWAVTLHIEQALLAHDLDTKWMRFNAQAVCQ